MKMIAIFGGAFNPITLGHAQTIEFLLKQLLDLDEIWITPTYCHTFNKEMISPKHRLEMCKIIKSKLKNKKVKIFDYEIKNKLKNGTLDFYQRLKKEKQFKDTQFFFVIGSDNINSMEHWINYKELIKSVHFIIVNRLGVKIEEDKNWYKKYPHIFLQPRTIIQTSSTIVRTLLLDYYKTKDIEIIKELRKHIEMPVLTYILKNKLYDEKTN